MATRRRQILFTDADASLGQKTVDHNLVRERSHIYLAVSNRRRAEFGVFPEVIAVGVLLAIPQLVAAF